MILLLGKLDYLELWYHNTGRWSVAFVADWGVLLLGLELQREQASWQQQQQKQFTTVAKHRNQQLKTNQSASHTHKIQYLILSLLGIFLCVCKYGCCYIYKKVYGFACFVLISCSFIVVLVGFLLGVHFVVNGSDVFFVFVAIFCTHLLLFYLFMPVAPHCRICKAEDCVRPSVRPPVRPSNYQSVRLPVCLYMNE